MDTAMVTDMAMEAMDITTARGRLRLPPMPRLATDTTVTAMVMDMVTAMDMSTDTATATARGRLRLLPLLSPAMDTTVMATDMVMDMDTDMAMAMEAMDITATMARDLLMLSPAMDTTVMVDMVVMDTTATDMAMATATTDKFLLLFSAVKSSVQTKNLDHLVLVLNFKILNKLLDKK